MIIRNKIWHAFMSSVGCYKGIRDLGWGIWHLNNFDHIKSYLPAFGIIYLIYLIYLWHCYRNIFIINLASSDMLIGVTMPFTALDSLYLHWPLTDQSPIYCRQQYVSSLVMKSLEMFQFFPKKFRCSLQNQIKTVSRSN